MHARRLPTVLLALLVLTACGGGSGGGSGGSSGPPAGAPESPTPQLEFGLKELRSSWNEVANATHYRLLANPDGVSGFTQVGPDLQDTQVAVTIPVHRTNWDMALYMVEACNSVGCAASPAQSITAGMLPTIGFVKPSTGAVPNSRFGNSVALSADGKVMAVGARGTPDFEFIDGQFVPVANVGRVHVFRHGPAGWVEEAELEPLVSDPHYRFGWAVALSADGSTLAVGAIGDASATEVIDGDFTDTSVPSAGAAYVYTNDGGGWTQDAYVKPSTATEAAFFGHAVALSADGTTLAVGSPGENSGSTGIGGDEQNESASSAGAAWVFTRDSLAWAQQAYVKASNTSAGSNFGFSLALSGDGDTLAVGAYNEGTFATGSGAAYVFTRQIGTWSQEEFIKIHNAGEFDAFGWFIDLSLDGNTLAGGAFLESGGGFGTGAAYVLVREGGVWTEQAYIKASNPSGDGGEQLGWSVALSGDGDSLAVGAIGENGGAAGVNGNEFHFLTGSVGAVYVHARVDDSWSQVAYVKPSNPTTGIEFGTAVALSGDGSTLAVGGTGEASSGAGIAAGVTEPAEGAAPNAGAVYLY